MTVVRFGTLHLWITGIQKKKSNSVLSKRCTQRLKPLPTAFVRMCADMLLKLRVSSHLPKEPERAQISYTKFLFEIL